MKIPKYFYFRVKTDEKHLTVEIEDASDVEVIEVRHGKWTFAGYTAYNGAPYKICSLCKNVYLVEDTVFNYCPNCGAKMDGGINE